LDKEIGWLFKKSILLQKKRVAVFAPLEAWAPSFFWRFLFLVFKA
jgi:hypothetical protein